MVKELELKKIGCRIKEARELREYTQRDVAKKVNVAPSTIMRYEQAKISDIKIPVIESIARALAVDPSWLLGFDVPMECGDTETELQKQELCDLFSLCYGNESYNVVQRFLKLDTNDRMAVSVMIDGLLSTDKYQEVKTVGEKSTSSEAV